MENHPLTHDMIIHTILRKPIFKPNTIQSYRDTNKKGRNVREERNYAPARRATEREGGGGRGKKALMVTFSSVCSYSRLVSYFSLDGI